MDKILRYVVLICSFCSLVALIVSLVIFTFFGWVEQKVPPLTLFTDIEAQIEMHSLYYVTRAV